MSPYIIKAELLRQIEEGFQAFEALVAPLSAAQMTTPTVNGTWSIKDNLAHLSAWHDYLAGVMRGVVSGEQPPAFVPGAETEDAENEALYLANRDRALDDVRRGFHTSYQDVLAALAAVDEDALNRPAPWSTSENPIWGTVAGNTYDHYEEHGAIIRRWLEAGG
jgi:hypothetical protein